ncbi:MAG: hypothetical protein LBB57_02705 [Clostridiales Family XIII bacterium]|jgi:hypothetical protein|nr:hypothetical protein [Clostridiales Family XIII bacterium]
MIKIPPDIEAAILKDRVTTAEIADVIKHCEDTRAKVLDAASGEYTGYGETGAITLWVRYKTAGADAEVLEYYFNRTRITGVSYPVAEPDLRLGPLPKSMRNRALLCCKCDVSLEIRKVLFKYMNRSYSAMSFACPICGQVYESQEVIRCRAEKVEALLEEK